MPLPFSAPHRLRLPKQQRGLATILIIVLAGLAITATSLGMMYAVRGAQETQISNHALVPAESKAWSGVEIMRLYLATLTAEQLAGLTAGKTLSTDASGVSFTVAETYNSTTKRVAVNVTGTSGTGSRSAATSTLQAVYTITPAQGGQTTDTTNNVVAVENGLSLSGSITILGGSSANFVVDGDVNISGSTTGMATLQSTGDIVLSGSTTIPVVFANGSLTMNGSTAATVRGSAIKWINNTSGSSNQGALRTNGYLTMGNGAGAEGYAIGDINITGGGATLKKVRSGANVTCPGTWWNNFDSIQSAKTTNCPSNSKVVTQVPTSELTPLTPITITRKKVDANDYKDVANYTFEFVNGKRKVTVKNINGLTDGDYYLGNFGWANNRGNYDYLCKDVDTNNNCTSPTAPNAATRTICQGNSTSNPCFDYNQSSATWSVSGKNLAPGVLWFKGNLNMGNGEYYNTTIASGNISTSGSHKLYALNYAGYRVVCTNAFKSNTTSDFAGLYPTNFCDIAAGKLKANAAGNIAYLAGIYTGSTFSGGNITVGASSEVFGTVLAGDQLTTGGSTTIHGYVNSAGQGTSVANNWSGSTTIDLRDLPDGYKPGESPGNGGSACTSNCSGGVSLTWARPI